MGKASVEELVRHLQSELESTTDIPDEIEREKRRWQLELAIQEALSFSLRYEVLEEAGVEPLKTVEATRLISDAQPKVQPQLPAGNDGWCTKCDSALEVDLDFCPACGQKR